MREVRRPGTDPPHRGNRSPRASKSCATATTSRTSTANTRADVMYGSGWVAAEDRGLLLKLGLGPAYAAALERPRASTRSDCCSPTARSRRAPKRSATSKNQKSVADRKRRPRANRSSKTSKTGSKASTPTRQTLPAPNGSPHVDARRAFAGFAFIGSIFGNGGGGEVANSNFLAQPAEQSTAKRRPEDLPRPARDQRPRSADDGQDGVPV